MYVLTLCRDYISVTSNGTFPGGGGGGGTLVIFAGYIPIYTYMYHSQNPLSHYSRFWCYIKNPP